MKPLRIVLATGGFDPIHEGHIAYLSEAKKLGDILIVGLNSTKWLIRKKGYAFHTEKTRLAVVEALRFVDRAFFFNDDDDTAIEAIKFVQISHPTSDIIFVNGGDRNKDNTPEMVIPGVEFIFGVGGYDKHNSSSAIVDNAKLGEIFSRRGS